MWFMLRLRNNKEFPNLKFNGYSNLKIFFILAFTSFLLGWIILIYKSHHIDLWQNIMKKLNQNMLKRYRPFNFI